MIVQNDSGQQFQVPDGSTPQDIDDVFQHYNSLQSYPSRVATDIGNSVNKGVDLATSGLDPLSGAIQAASQGANAALAPVKEAIPDAISQPLSKIGTAASNAGTNAAQSLANALDSTSAGQAAGDYGMNSPNLQKGMQTVSDDAKAAANLLTLAPAGKAVEGVTKPLLGDPIYNSAKNSYIQDLVLPKATPTIAAQNALRTKQVGGTNVYQPTPWEQNMAQQVGQIEGVGPLNSAQKNLNLIQAANTQEAQSLKATLNANNVPIPANTIISNIQNIRNTLPKNTNISAPGEMTIERVVNAGINHITNNPLTASGMLQARKDFDSQMIKERGDGVFDPTIETPRSNAISAVRNSMNNMVATAVPNADVMASLSKQNALYSAADNIAVKAAKEAPTPVQRFLQNFNPHNAMTGGGIAIMGDVAHNLGVPAAAMAIPAAIYGGYRIGKSPFTRGAVGSLLGGGD
jgi:hypothetical protein